MAIGLNLEQVSLVINSVPVLQDVTCEFKAGQSYLITGDNGAGKTSLLKIMHGLIQPTIGKVIYDAPVDVIRQGMDIIDYNE